MTNCSCEYFPYRLYEFVLKAAPAPAHLRQDVAQLRVRAVPRLSGRGAALGHALRALRARQVLCPAGAQRVAPHGSAAAGALGREVVG